MAHRTTLLYVRTVSALRRVLVREEGAGMVEYALLITLIAIVLIGAITVFSSALNTEFNSIASSVEEA